MKSILAAAAVLSSLAFSTTAHATPITYQFNFNITAAGGGTMSGMFTFDAANNLESNVSITIAGGHSNGLPIDTVFSQDLPIPPPPPTGLGSPGPAYIVGTSSIGDLAWVGIDLGPPPTIVDYGFKNTFGGGFGVARVSIAVTPLALEPEPASLAVLTVGLLGLVAQRRRKRPATLPATPA